MPKKLIYYAFCLMSEKSIKAVIRHLLADTPAENISSGLEDLGFSIMSIRQMTVP
jgi:hypothetical protein